MGDVSPAEALVLLNPASARAAEALRLTLLSLLMRRVLRLENEAKRWWFGITREVAHVRRGRVPGTGLPPYDASLLYVVRRSGDGSIPHLVAAARAAYGDDLAGFLDRLLIEPMRDRGLVARVPFRLFGLIRYDRLVLTEAGEDLRVRVGAALALANTIPDVLPTDPARAAAILAEVGDLVLLLPALRPHLRKLAAIEGVTGYADKLAGSLGSIESVPSGADVAGGWDSCGLDAGFAAFSGFDACFGHGGGHDGGHGHDGGGGHG